MAKSEPQVTLQQHIEDCLRICRQLQLCVPNIPIKEKRKFWNILKECIVFHDLGKAHREFQKMLRHIGNHWYHQRHELFSLYFIANSEISESNRSLPFYVVAGHHKSLSELSEFIERNYTEDDWDEDGLDYSKECSLLPMDKIQVLLKHYGIKIRKDRCIPDINKMIRRMCKENNPLLKGDGLKHAILVGAMKQCDHMASAGIQNLQKLEGEDFSCFHEYPLYDHQKKDSITKGNVILNSPTGSGKTESAMLWLGHQIDGYGQGRTYYILPYTASINAMYERLVKIFGERKVGILHGKLAEYLEANMSEGSNNVADIRKQIDDFKSMMAPIKVVTPFQLLKCVFGLKGFEKGFLEWCGGYFIIDEIHAYDAKTFAQIVVLLHLATKRFGVKVHIMTATLPVFMRKELESVISPYIDIVANESLYKTFTRHRVILKEGKLSDSLEDIQKEIDEGIRILVVCNTVNEAQYVYKSLNANEKVLLHGRFNGEDRFKKEKLLSSESVQLLVGTQAIEISLDIDFDELYSEPAPLDALLQRFGRVNRKRKKGICNCHVFKERNNSDKHIYSDENVIKRTLAVLECISETNNGILNEAIIGEAMNCVYPSWSDKQKEDFETTKSLLEKFIANRLKPLEFEEQNEEDFYKQFDGCKVLPVCLTTEYQNRLNENNLVKAESLLVTISVSMLKMCLSNGDVVQQSYAFQVGDEVRTKSEYIIKKAYTSEIGLEFGSINTNSITEDNFL